MILFFGTRPGKTVITQLPDTACPYCNQIGTLQVSKTSSYFHLFWIKLFKITTDTIAECSHCKRVYYENEFTEAMRKELP
ncbi:zinc-ribbon domain-containing protein [Maribacter sp. 2210JD10-5]|uniref:zinc-ribbon domain-containing protein n=1 Tax=Maribacter sp. 2210JD10-5 TaxID=3386272 RepID=UPI0039BD02B9